MEDDGLVEDSVADDDVLEDRVDDDDRDGLDDALDESPAITGADSRVQERKANAAIAPTSLWLTFLSPLMSNICFKLCRRPFVGGSESFKFSTPMSFSFSGVE